MSQLPLDAYFAWDKPHESATLGRRPPAPLDHWAALSMMRQYRPARAGSWALLRRLARAQNPRAQRALRMMD